MERPRGFAPPVKKIGLPRVQALRGYMIFAFSLAFQLGPCRLTLLGAFPRPEDKRTTNPLSQNGFLFSRSLDALDEKCDDDDLEVAPGRG